MDQYPLVRLPGGTILVFGRLFGPRRSIDIRMILDTAASTTAIVPDVVSEVGIDPSAGQIHRLHTFGGVVDVPVVVAPCLRVFGQSVEKLAIACANLPSRLMVEGVLGLNFLEHFDLRINFREEFIELG